MNPVFEGPMALCESLDRALAAATFSPPLRLGRVVRVVGTLIQATGVSVRIGDLCRLSQPGTGWTLTAEVVGASGDIVTLMPFGEITGLSTHTHVSVLGRIADVAVSDTLLGCVVDGFGNRVGGPALPTDAARVPVNAPAPDPLTRPPVNRVLATGIRAIDGLLTCGVGQRIGIFAPAGAGKSSLLSMLARGTQADVVVVALVGERGREVGDFLADLDRLGARGKTVCVVATSDRPAAERAKAPSVAMAIAEHFRDQGRTVLLLADSVTRYARALREIGLAAGEPPTRRGYPPSVFAALPRLFERAGTNAHGAISAFFTVLVEDDAAGDPIAEEVRSTLDGHLMLSPRLADAGHYPPIDVLASCSRVLGRVVSAEQTALARDFRELLHKHASIETLVQIGEYKSGSDAQADRAIELHAAQQRFLRQALDETGDFEDALQQLRRLLGGSS